MPEGCAEWRGLLAEHAVAADRQDAGLSAHLDGCRPCRAELTELRAVVAALALADPGRLIEHVAVPPAGLDALLARISTERARNAWRRRRVGASVLAVAVAVVVLGLGLGLRSRQGDDVGGRLAFADAPAGVSASARLQARPWGTAIELAVSGLAPGHAHAVWLEDPSGHRTPAGTFMPVQDRTVTVGLAAASTRADAVALGVSDDTGRTVLRALVTAADLP